MKTFIKLICSLKTCPWLSWRGRKLVVFIIILFDNYCLNTFNNKITFSGMDVQQIRNDLWDLRKDNPRIGCGVVGEGDWIGYINAIWSWTLLEDFEIKFIKKKTRFWKTWFVGILEPNHPLTHPSKTHYQPITVECLVVIYTYKL